MTTGRIHWRAGEKAGIGPIALCNWFGGGQARYTTDESAVTCRRCRKGVRTMSAIEALEPVATPTGWQPATLGCRTPARVREHIETETHLQWPSWRAALRALVSFRDDGAPLKSSSEPSRFETLPQISRTPDGDRAQRAIDDLAAVSKALSRAYVSPFVVMTLPRREVSVEMCLAILVSEVVGKAVAPDKTERRARRAPVMERRPQEREDIAAEATKAVGWPVTVTTVAEIVRRGGLRIEADLERGQWITQRDDALHRIEESDMSEKGKRLRGQKEIAEHLQVDVRTVQRMKSWSPPIPIVEVGGIDEAWTRVLDDWRDSGPRATKESA